MSTRFASKIARTACRSARIASRPTLQRAALPSTSTSTSTSLMASMSSSSRCLATATTPTSSVNDPQADAAQAQLDEGNLALQSGDLDTAEQCYKKSLDIKETSVAHYNMGVVRYSRSDLPGAISSFEASLEHFDPSVKPPSIPEDPNEPIPALSPAQQILADTHMNLGAAYILATPPRPDKALEHLQKALSMNPEDGEVCFNLAAVLEATGEDEEALIAYQRAEKLGIERAATNIRNLGAKMLGKARKEQEDKQKNGGSLHTTEVDQTKA